MSKQKLATNVSIREVGNGYMVEVYVYAQQRNNCQPCAPQCSPGYDMNTYVAKTFEAAQELAAKIRLEKINALEKAA